MLLDRLRNDITRLTAVKAITTVAHSPLPIDLNLVIEPVLTELTSFMRKANRPLKQASLSAMEVGPWSYHTQLSMHSVHSSELQRMQALCSFVDGQAMCTACALACWVPCGGQMFMLAVVTSLCLTLLSGLLGCLCHDASSSAAHLYACCLCKEWALVCPPWSSCEMNGPATEHEAVEPS